MDSSCSHQEYESDMPYDSGHRAFSLSTQNTHKYVICQILYDMREITLLDKLQFFKKIDIYIADML